MAEIRKDYHPEDLQPLLQKCGFGGCISVQVDPSEEETDFLLNYAHQHDFIKGVVGWVDLFSVDVEKRLEKFARNPFLKGIRTTVWDEKGEFMTDPAFQNGISALKKFDLTYDILAFDYQLSGAVELAKKIPNQLFVLDHMGKPSISESPSKEWEFHIKELGQMENVFCKISGMVTETDGFNWKTSDFSPFLDVVVEAFGPQRLMFGSDWPVCLPAARYEEVVGIVEAYFTDFSEEIRRVIFGANAVKFYNLKVGNV